MCWQFTKFIPMPDCADVLAVYQVYSHAKVKPASVKRESSIEATYAQL